MVNEFIYQIVVLCCYVTGITSVTNYHLSRDCQHRYSIVIDGGSSGTRLNVFKFNVDNPRNPTINQTYSFKSKIALSSFSMYREDWSLMRIMLTNLTDNALVVIDEQCVQDTPVYLQVTAGIRQIEQRIGSRILMNIKSILSKSRYRFRNEFVDVLSPTVEGQLAWISVNYLLGNLRESEDDSQSTIGILDLGGGSTQIAFATDRPDLVKRSSMLLILGRNYSVYSCGYDYMGINEARLKYFNAQSCDQSNCRGKMFHSQCLHPEVVSECVGGNRTIHIGGQIIRDDKRFCHCFAKGLQLTKPVTMVREYFGTKKFLAFSVYYYVLKNAGNIFHPTPDGRMFQTNIRDIIFRAMEICGKPRPVSKTNRFGHFQCIDLSYLVALLHNGYGFEWYDEILSTMKINDISLSWALGYAISKF